MICFIVASGHNYTVRDVRRAPEAPSIFTLSYDRLIGARKLKTATYVFTDFDRLSCADLKLAGPIYLQLRNAGLKVLNNPAKAKTRYSLLRALHRSGSNDFNVYRASEIPGKLGFPVFIRKIQGHGRPCTGLLHLREEVEQAVRTQVESGIPADHLMIIEYAGEPIRPGAYREICHVSDRPHDRLKFLRSRQSMVC